MQALADFWFCQTCCHVLWLNSHNLAVGPADAAKLKDRGTIVGEPHLRLQKAPCANILPTQETQLPYQGCPQNADNGCTLAQGTGVPGPEYCNSGIVPIFNTKAAAQDADTNLNGSTGNEPAVEEAPQVPGCRGDTTAETDLCKTSKLINTDKRMGFQIRRGSKGSQTSDTTMQHADCLLMWPTRFCGTHSLSGNLEQLVCKRCASASDQ